MSIGRTDVTDKRQTTDDRQTNDYRHQTDGSAELLQESFEKV